MDFEELKEKFKGWGSNQRTDICEICKQVKEKTIEICMINFSKKFQDSCELDIVLCEECFDKKFNWNEK